MEQIGLMTFSLVIIASWHLGEHFAGNMQDDQDIVLCHRSSRRAFTCIFLHPYLLNLECFLEHEGIGTRGDGSDKSVLAAGAQGLELRSLTPT